MNAAAVAHAAKFLTALYGEGAPGYIVLWTRQDKRSVWLPATDLPAAAQQGCEMANTMDVYFGVGLQQGPPNPGRGEAASVCAIPGFWADIDVAGPAHKADSLPPDTEAARAVLRELYVEPSLIIHSGHGLQAYWLFHELWVLDTDSERQCAADQSRRFQAALQQAAQLRGWSIDNTSDLARVLRLPGTYNRKLDPRPVRILKTSEHGSHTALQPV